jgi:hypothetical protein
MAKAFSNWCSWARRATLANIGCPGVYALAKSQTDISETRFSLRPEIIYFGATNSMGGLKSRLQQFENTIKGKRGHGGAARVRFKHSDYPTLSSQLYVAVRSWDCDVASNDAANLRIMGDVVKYEYECFASFVERFGRMPEFNDKKKSPKK